MEDFAYGEISERTFRNPHPWNIWTKQTRGILKLVLVLL